MKTLQSKWLPTLGWIGITLLLSCLTFGVVRMIYFSIYLSCFIVGACLVLHDISSKILQKEENVFYLHAPFEVSNSTGIKKFVEQAEIKPSSGQPKKDNRITGCNQMDGVIRECLEFLIRDYIKDWYHELTDDQEFFTHLDQCIHEVIVTFVRRCKSTDWQQHLTETVIEGLASHVRLFRRSQEKLAKTTHQSKDSLETGSDNISISSQKSFGDTAAAASAEKQPPAKSLKDVFFEFEQSTYGVSREMISCDPKKQKQYLQDLSEVLLYLLLPKHDFHCRPLKLMIREVLVNGVFKPMIGLYSDPDYLNQYTSWAISDSCLSSECFLAVLRHTSVVEELLAVREKSDEEFEKLRSKDTVGDDFAVKQQLSSIRYVKTLCEKRLRIFREGSTSDAIDMDLDGFHIQDKSKLYNLPLTTILHNNIALQIFIDYMQSVNGQAYLFFWLTIEGYRASAEQQIEVKASQLQGSIHSVPDMEMLRDIGRNIYDQYLSKQADPRLPIDNFTDRQLTKKLNSGEPSAYIFDDIQQKVYQAMLKEEVFYPSFKNTKSYMKLLAELDLLRVPSINSLDTTESALDETDGKADVEVDMTFKLAAEINQTGICTEHGKTYALYAISVARSYSNGTSEKWDTFRRYREFNDLHQNLKENGCNMTYLRFPSKTLFKDLKEEFLEKRRNELNVYLEVLLNMEHLDDKCQEIVHTFLDAKAYQKTNRTFASKFDSVMRSSVKNVTNFMSNAPDSFIDGIQKASDKVSDSLLKFSDILPGSSSNSQDDTDDMSSFSDRFDQTASDQQNIWLGTMILLMDEVFDLKNRNQWLRRQILTAIQQFVRTLFGDRMNKRISDYIDNAISPQEMALYIVKFRDNFWPQGILAEASEERELYTKMRTRVLAKTKLNGTIPDELKPVVGNETCRTGMTRIFEMMQISEINTRVCFLQLEGVLMRVFPCNNFAELTSKFHDKRNINGSDGGSRGETFYRKS